ncbi:MAG: MaoC family dehydratase [Actinobacteria bacterium]|nr:MaoC family dehydratase [Actinomycetota bacterium]
MLTITGLEEIRAKVGAELGVSEWHDVTQADVDAFAEVTGDHQWIHTDVARASQTEFGGTIAHGFYTLSLAPKLVAELGSFEHFAFAVNYGLNRVRFISPLPVGDRVRMRARLDAVERRAGGASLTATLTFERERDEKPVCVAELLTHLQP